MSTNHGREHLVRLAKTAYSVTAEPQDALDLLEDVVRLQWMLDQARQHLVSGARDDGRNWGQIGSALGISRQAARERYGLDPAGDVVDPL